MVSKKRVSFKKEIVNKKIIFKVDKIRHYPHYVKDKIKPLDKKIQLKIAIIELERLKSLKQK